MSDVKWIKLSTQMFDDEKIKLIEHMPDSDAMLVIWIKLLAQAGKTNASGYIYLSENIPYSDEMLSAIFNRPLQTVRLALQTFQSFGMIEILDNNFIVIENWEKHQNVAGMDKIREQTKKRVAKHRELKKVEQTEKSVTLHVTDGNAIERDKELELELELDKDLRDKDIESIPFSEIIDYLNMRTDSKYKASSKKTKGLIQSRWRDGFRVDDFKMVIDKKTSDWLNDPKMAVYLRPETLFGAKFEGYLNQKGGSRNGQAAAASQISAEYNLGF